MSRVASIWIGAALLPLAFYTIVYWSVALLQGAHPKIEAEGGSLSFFLNVVAMLWPIWMGWLAFVVIAFLALRWRRSRVFEESE
ncbi:hypothetical protein K3181_02125 [Qipengyuania sp. YG27]|uniref:Uncharacterized protein n=1 Tax=Qipengyuania mesophila TaxID=2867246 RepID=A0ABS7JRG5_9SPHN|nr:hypothetical protein [Qipengyuania mesophila]MBX7500240.1 hypothetical protein [Qipengyuania mesophila]